MITGKTKSGFEFNVDENTIKSWDLTESVVMMESDNGSERLTGNVKFVNIMLGDQKKALKKHLESVDGIATTEKMVGEAAEILTIAQEKDAEIKK